MAWRRLARDAATHLRREVPPTFAPARTFSAATRPPVANPTLYGRQAVQNIWSRGYSSSSPALQAGIPKFGALLKARMSPELRRQLPGLLKGFGTSATLAAMLYPKRVAEAEQRQPADHSSEGISVSSEYSKQRLRDFWNLLRKFQLPIGLILLIAYGWRHPIALAINILLLLYSSRPDPYSIYLFLQEINERKESKNPALWKEEYVQTRKVDTEDYKFFSIGRVELKNRKVLHVIGVLGSWWIYHVSYVKREERVYFSG